MKIEEQVTSLELSKRLKELGVKTPSEYWWIRLRLREGADWKLFHGSTGNVAVATRSDKADCIRAYSVAELVEAVMPFTKCYCRQTDGKYFTLFSYDIGIKIYIEDRLSDCLAKMLIWLIEKGYVTTNRD